MRKMIALFLSLALICSFVSFSYADESQQTGGFFGSLGTFFSNAWNEASTWVEGAWESTSTWINGAWGDASKWIEQTWNDSSSWISDIWGNASDWATNTVGAWWTKTFQSVTSNSKETWRWLQDKSVQVRVQDSDTIERVKSAVTATGDNAEREVTEIAFTLMEKLNISKADAEKVQATIQAYADQTNIKTISIEKLTIPYLFRLCADSTNQTSGNIPAIAVAQYLTGALDSLSINDDNEAENLIDQLIETLASI